MKKFSLMGLIFVALLFEGCFSLPGYVNSDGSITPPYSKMLLIEVLSGTVTISPSETSKGITNINPAKSDALRTQTQNAIFLGEGKDYYYNIEGNHSVVLAFRTLDKEAVFRVSYKGEVTEYTIHNSDLMDKFVYIENY